MALAIDTSASGHINTSNGTATTGSFSTSGSNELLLALTAFAGGSNAGGQTISSVTGASLTWTLAKRQNTKAGTAEIWYAFATGALTSVTVSAHATGTGGTVGGLLVTVTALSGVDTTSGDGASAIGAVNGASASSGAPTCSLTTTRDGSWVFGVGDDWDNAVTPVAGSDQTIPANFFYKDTSSGDTGWAQQQNAATATSGTSVTINNTAPTADQWNLAIVEILAASGGPPPPTPVSSMMLLGCGS